MNALTSPSVMTSGYDPGVEPNFSAPWMTELQNIGGMVLATALVLFVIAVVAGLVVWLFGKLSGGGRAQDTGLSILLWGVVAAVVVGSIGGIIAWATGIPVFA